MLRIIGYSLLFTLLWSCGVERDPLMRYVGHGGMGNDGPYPMNSANALRGALALGLDGVELDVQLTSDSVLIAYHPGSLEELTPCSGLVNAISWTRLKQCPDDKSADDLSPLVRVDTLLLQLAREYPNADFTLDCKLFAHGEWWPYLRTYTAALARLDSVLPGKMIVECQVEDLLRIVQHRIPTLRSYLYGTNVDAAIRRAATSHYEGVTFELGDLTKEDVRMAHELGLKVAIFGVESDWDHKCALDLGVDRIQTDDLTPFR